MKKDLTELIWQSPEIDVKNIRAERLEELKKIAEYRLKFLPIIKDWAIEEKRNEMKAKWAGEEKEGRAKLSDIPAESIAVRSEKKSFITRWIPSVLRGLFGS